MKLKELIDKANFSYVNENITEENFPLQSDGLEPIDLYQPTRIMTTAEVMVKCTKDGYQPARIEHLIQYAIKHPKNDENVDYLTALGSEWRDSDGNLLVPYLRWYGGEWLLFFLWLDCAWYARGRFARIVGTSEPRCVETLDVLYCGHCGKKL